MASELSTTGAAEVEPGKLFVGGLSWGTTKDTLKQYFSRYGEVDDCTVMTDQAGNPRGFGFVKFTNPEEAATVLETTDHTLDGKKIDPKPATKNNPQHPPAKVKVFVGGIPPETSTEDLRKAFSQFGAISVNNGVEIKNDPHTTRPRGFGFVTFESPESAANAVREKWVTMNEKQVEVKVAENPKPKFRGQGAYPGGGTYNGYGGQSYQPDSRHMTQQQPTNYTNYPTAYAATPYQQSYGYGQGGYSNSSGGYPMYSQGTSPHAQAVNNFDGYSGYSTSRESASYTPQQYGYTQQQQQPYGGNQASHTTAYGRSQQGYNGYPVRQ